jgi:hypothetical protein
MKIIILIVFFCVNLNILLKAQQNNFSNHVLIYQPVNAIDTALAGNSMYCYIDKNSFIHWSSQPFRNYDIGGGAIDTIKYKDTFTLTVRDEYMTHRITSIYKFSLQKNKIRVTEILPNGKMQKAPYVDLSFKTLNPDFSFFGGFDKLPEYYGRKSISVKTKLLNVDTVITFNNKIFHCWKLEAHLIETSLQHYSNYFIDKKTLLPIAMDIFDTVNSRSPEKLKESKTVYTLFGILEFNKQLMKGLHIWEDNKQ